MKKADHVERQLKASLLVALSLVLNLLPSRTACAQENLVVNGNFEDLWHNWDYTFNVGIGGRPAGVDGLYHVSIYESISQNLQTTPGQTYHLTFFMAGLPNVGLTTTLAPRWGQTSLEPIICSPTGKTLDEPGWIRKDYDLVAQSAQTRLVFENPGGYSPTGFAPPILDGVSVYAVPEPSTFALVVVGCPFMFAIYLKRRRRS